MTDCFSTSFFLSKWPGYRGKLMSPSNNGRRVGRASLLASAGWWPDNIELCIKCPWGQLVPNELLADDSFPCRWHLSLTLRPAMQITAYGSLLLPAPGLYQCMFLLATQVHSVGGPGPFLFLPHALPGQLIYLHCFLLYIYADDFLTYMNRLTQFVRRL